MAFKLAKHILNVLFAVITKAHFFYKIILFEKVSGSVHAKTYFMNIAQWPCFILYKDGLQLIINSELYVVIFSYLET